MIRNISWNIFAQIISFAVPLITLPLLVRRLGLENYGIYTLSLLLWQSLTILMDYSFNTAGIQRISNSSDKELAFNEILAARFVIAIGCILLLPLLSFVFLKSFHLWFLSGGVVFIFGYFLINSQWYYANEQFKSLALINLISRSCLLVLISAFSYSAVSAMFSQSLSMLLSGIISLVVSKYYKYIKFSSDSFKNGINFIYSSRQSFGANFIGYLLSNSPLLVGSFVLSPGSYGTYAIADRIVRVFLALYGGASQVIFRRSVALASEKRDELYGFIHKTILKTIPAYSAIAFLGIIAIYFFQSFIFHSTDKINFEILILLSFWSIISVFNSIVGFVYLQSIEKYQVYFYIMLLALCLTMTFIFIFGRLGSGVGITISLISIELIIALICLYIFSFGRIK